MRRLLTGFCLISLAASAQTPPFSFFARRDILPSTFSNGFAGSALGVADFNGDGIADMAIASASGFVIVSIGSGNLTYAPAFYAAPGDQFGPGEPETIVIGDFNNDGHPDFAVGTFNGGVGIYMNKGDGTFLGPVTYQVGDDLGLATADVDGDGNLDLVGEGFIMLGLGNGKFEVPAPLVRSSTRPAGRRLAAPQATSIIGSTVALADLNGDGFIDVVVTGSLLFGESQVALGNGNGTFGKFKSANLPQAAAQVAIADFNGDGKPDLAFSLTNGSAAVCLGNGDGTFQKPQAIPVSNIAGQAVIAADLNGDGKMDIAVLDLNRGGLTLALASPMGVIYGNGDGTFQRAVIYETIFPFDIAAGDLDGDGRPDLVVTGGEETDPLIFAFLATPNGSFQAAPHFSTQTTAPEAFAAGDFNGDGKLDLAVTGTKSNNVGILLGNGRGGFSAGGTFPTGPFPVGVVSADFNGDGKADLAVVNNGLDNVSILLGNGDGTFGPAVNFGAGQSPVFVIAADFNGDGKIDLAVTNSGGSNLSVLMGEGDGTFSAPTNFATGKTPEFLAAGDLNGDGQIDLAVANNGAGTVSVLFGNGDGTFQSPATLATGGTFPAGIAIADFNGDSKPDIVVSNNGSSSVSVFLGNGKGSFQNAIASPVGFSSEPWALVTGDFNRDGNMDVAAVAYGLQDIALLPGLGNGSFGPVTLAGADALPFAIASLPLSPGRPRDLVVVNEERGLVSVLRGTAR